MANPTTNYGWPMPTSSDLVTDLPADFDAFGQPVDNTLKALNPETTLGDIAYRSAVSNTNTRLAIGTNGQVLSVSGGVPAWTTTADVTPLTTKGDVFTFSTEDARIGVGADGTVLTANSSEATGLEWATPPDQSPLTTKGDVFTFSTVDARLGVGANDTVLTADSSEATGLKWAAPAGSGFVGCQLTNSGPKTLTTGTSTIITFDTEKFDTDAFHSTVTNTGRITIPSGKGGKYLFTAKVVFQGNATGVRYASFKKNGTTQYRIMTLQAVTSGAPDVTGYTMSQVFDLVATDYIELVCLQTSGGNLNVLGLSDGDTEEVYFTAQFLGA